MQKLFLALGFFALGASVAFADITLTDVHEQAFCKLPANFTADNCDKAVLCTDNGLEIYNDEFNLEKQIEVDANVVSATWSRYIYDDFGPYKETDYTDTYAPKAMQLNVKFADVSAIYAAQTLFNSDDKYEYILPIVEPIDLDNCTYVDWYAEGQVLGGTGFKVMSEDGSVICSVSLPSGYYLSSFNYMDLMELSGKAYLCVTVEDGISVQYGSGASYYLIYAIDNKTSSVKSIGAPIKAKVHPTTPEHGTAVNIDLPENATHGCNVVVTSASGKVVINQKIAADTTHTAIDTSALPRGLYVVTVDSGNGAVESTKIIIR